MTERLQKYSVFTGPLKVESQQDHGLQKPVQLRNIVRRVDI